MITLYEKQAEALIRAAGEVIGRHFDRLERELGVGPYLGGPTFGLADVALIPAVTLAVYLGFSPDARHPRLADWLRRMLERDSVQRDRADVLPSIGTFKAREPLVRQYRDHRLEWMLKHGGREIVLDGLARGNIRFTPDV